MRNIKHHLRGGPTNCRLLWYFESSMRCVYSRNLPGCADVWLELAAVCALPSRLLLGVGRLVMLSVRRWVVVQRGRLIL